MRALSAEERLRSRMERLIQGRRNRLAVYIERIRGLSPLEKLNSGYAFVSDESGANIRSVSQAQPGKLLTVQVRDGRILARAEQVLPD